MLRTKALRMAGILFALALALPTLAAPHGPKQTGNQLRGTITLFSSAKFAGQELKAGNYDVSAAGDKVKISRDGRKVAEAPAEWKQGPKPRVSSVVLDSNNAIKEIHFSGKDHYVALE